MRMKLKKEVLCKFEELIMSIESAPVIFTRTHPTHRNEVDGMNLLIARTENNHEVGLFYDMGKCVPHVRQSGLWFELIL